MKRATPILYGTPVTIETEEYIPKPLNLDKRGLTMMPKQPRVCDYRPCKEIVEPPQRKYCSDGCRKASARGAYAIRQADGDLPLEDKIERERLRLQNRSETRTLQQLQRTEAKRREYLGVLRETITPFEVSELIVGPKLKSNPAHVAWSIDLSDWQVGQYTPIQSTGGMYEQTTEVAKKQLDKIWKALQSIFDIEIGSGKKKLEEIWLLFNGDLVEGDCLRPSQARAIDLTVTQQTIEVADLAALFIRRVLTLPGIKNIVIDMVGGNHDRTSSKAGNAGLGELDFVDTYAWLIGHWLDRIFVDEPRVNIKVWDTFYGYRVFGGLNHAFEHGASFRGGSGAYGGVPWYPISNAARKYGDMLGSVDIVHMGHFHQPAVLPLGQAGWVFMNGALPVSSQFIQSSFKAMRAPLQWLVEYNVRKRWVNNWHPLYADIGQFVKQGEVWNGEGPSLTQR